MRYIRFWNQFESTRTRLGRTSYCRNCVISHRWRWSTSMRK